MTIEMQVLAAVVLDITLGDPKGWPHPVRWIGRLACAVEMPLRARIQSARQAGVAAVLTVLGAVGFTGWFLLWASYAVHTSLGDAVSVALLYTCFAGRDLADHGLAVLRELEGGQMVEAREKLGMMVGRDTEGLDEPEIVRGTVESLAENLVDGVTAPMLFAILGGPIGALLYKAVNTLDSTFGYKNERYMEFGWASARLDDVANFIPARLTAPLVAVAAKMLGMRARAAWDIFLRDGAKHPSPNSGLSEAAVAGALGVRLGGMNYYGGVGSEKPFIGDSHEPLNKGHIWEAIRLMTVTAMLALVLFFGLGQMFF